MNPVIIVLAIAAGYFFLRTRGISDQVRARLSPSLIEEIEAVSGKTGVPADLIGAIVMVESAGNPVAVGSIGERGLMQLTKGAIDDVNSNFGTNFFWNLMFTRKLNLLAGAYYLKLQKKRLGSWDDAIRAYNAGERGAKLGRAQEYLTKVKSWL